MSDYSRHSRAPLGRISPAQANKITNNDSVKNHSLLSLTASGFDITALKKNAPTRVRMKKTTPPKTDPPKTSTTKTTPPKSSTNSNNQKTNELVTPLKDDKEVTPKEERKFQPIEKRDSSLSPKEEPQKIVVNNKIYYIDHLIGSGGSSVVYVVTDENGTKLAMKIVNLAVQKPDVREGLLKEIEILKLFRGSKRVIQMIDSYEDVVNQKIYIIQELGGEDLRSFIEKNLKSYDYKLITNLWIQMLEAVKECHDRNILHADLKPENFLFVGDKLKLIDFGIALRVGTYDMNTTSVIRDVGVGTLSYMAPEAINMDSEIKIVGRPADVWALGAILYRLVFQNLPFPQTAAFVKMGAICGKFDYEPKYDRIPGLSRNPEEFPLIVDCIKRCLVRDPKQRITINELLVHPYVKEYKMQNILHDFIIWVQEGLPIDISEPDANDYFQTDEGYKELLSFFDKMQYIDTAMERDDYEDVFLKLGEEIITDFSDSLFDCDVGERVIRRLSKSYLAGESLSVQNTLQEMSNKRKHNSK